MRFETLGVTPQSVHTNRVSNGSAGGPRVVYVIGGTALMVVSFWTAVTVPSDPGEGYGWLQGESYLQGQGHSSNTVGVSGQKQRERSENSMWDKTGERSS